MSAKNKNKENMRRCYKCGQSPIDNPSTTLFRFPKPGKTNTFRCESWAKYVFPDRESFSPEFQEKLYREHRMLCNRHFAKTSFSDYPLSDKKLHRFAVPEDMDKAEPQPGPSHATYSRAYLAAHRKPLQEHTPIANVSMTEPQPGPSHATFHPAYQAKHCMPLEEHTNIANVSMAEPQPGPSHATYPRAYLAAHCMPLQEHTPIANVSMQLVSTSDDPIPGPQQQVLKDISNQVPRTSEPTKSVEIKAGTSTLKQEITRDGTLYKQCRNNLKKICQLRKQIHKLKNKVVLQKLDTEGCITNISNKITPGLALLLQGEIKNFKKHTKGRRWTKEEKIIALRIYKRSPTCYRLLRRIFCLPAPGTLQTLLSHFPLQVGINNRVFKILKNVVSNMMPADNEFVLLFDEMSIRKNLKYNRKSDIIEGHQDHDQQGRSYEIATHALVFMICGIRKKIKQPIAFYFSGSFVTADRLAILIKEILNQCFEANINITATVCDMDGVNRRALNILGATVEDPRLKLDNQTVISFYDTPHLLKCFRNLFLKYNIEYIIADISSDNSTGKGIAKWSYIKDFYDLDNINPNFVFAPSLRQEHLDPNAKQKMRVKLAAQVLSHSVAAGMYCKISQGELPSDAVITANLVSKMDKLFDCLNSDSPDLRRGKPYSTNLTNKTPHLALLKDMKLFFKNLKFIGCRSKPPSLDGWVWTITAFEQYWSNLKQRKPNIRSLATRRLQQDPLENLFGCIRGLCGSNYNPTAGQFVAALKTIILNNLPNTGTVGGNCETDHNNSMFDNFKILLTQKQCIEDSVSCEDVNSFQNCIEININDNNVFQECNAEMQACAYVCGFILKKYKNNCTVCFEKLKSKDIELEHNFIEFKEYSDFKKSLKYASKQLITCVEDCATKINVYLEKKSHTSNIRQNIMTLLKNTVNFSYLSCNSHKQYNENFIINSTFYICIKRFCFLKNRKFVEEATKLSLRNKINILKHV